MAIWSLGLTSQRMPQSYCLNTCAKCDLEWKSKQVLKKWCQGRVAHELTRDWIDKLVFKSSKPHGTSTKVITSSLVDICKNSSKELWGNQLALNIWPKHEAPFQKLILKHFYAHLGNSKHQTKLKKSTYSTKIIIEGFF